MTQGQVLDILKTGANVFLTGEPGSGKTHTINEYVSYLRSMGVEPSITASTGIAATHIGGYTIHSWSGIGIKRDLDEYELDRIAQNEKLTKRINRAKVLIIDEVSMLSATTFSMVDMVCKEVRRSAKAFGGMQVVVVGDFFQLPPINKREDSLLEKTSEFAYHSPAWHALNLVPCYLSEQHRQEDEVFLEVLSAMRSDVLNDSHIKHLRARSITPVAGSTILFPHNVDVDRINEDELGKINGPTRVYEMHSSGSKPLVEQLKRSCLSPERLVLKVGAKIMFTKNNPDEGYVNGTTGEVVGFSEYPFYPIVKSRSGEKITVEPLEWSVEADRKVLAKITQIPLRLAWAITVHKSQGMSLDTAVVDLRQAFEYGQGYVALSRVRTLGGLYLLGFNQRALEVHPEILEQDVEFREESSRAEKVFNAMNSTDLTQLHKNFLSSLGATPATKIYSVDKIRESHAQAYSKWSEQEDANLVAEFKSGSEISEIAIKHGRNIGAIRARLIKLGLIEK